MKKILIIIALIFSVYTNSFSSNSNTDSGLVAYYPFNGNSNDESGNGNHGTNYGATLTTDRFGNSNKAYFFNNTYIQIPNSPSLQYLTSSMTLAFWTNISQWDNNFAGFMAKSNSGSLGQYGAIASTNPNYIQFDLGGQYVRITRYFALNTWYFICLKWDGQKAKLYLNGTVYDSISFSGTAAPDNNPLILGKHTPGTARYLIGKLDDVRIYNRAVSDSEIEKLYYESKLNIKLIPQGFYNTSSQGLSMKDTVRCYIRESFSPYQILDSSRSVIDSVTFQGNFITFVTPGTYYIVIKHRNSIETWSSSPVYIKESISYDFTSSQSQAYGNNLILKGSRWCIYGGDINQDGIIDAEDLGLIDNDVYNFTGGYIRTDLTGDNFTDISDYIIADNNAFNYVSAITPDTYQAPCNLTFNRSISWSGFNWMVVSSNETKCNPGHNYFSSSVDNVMTDSAGDLHIRITKRNGKYYCAELFTTEAVGYGLYTFYLSSRVDNLDKNVVLGIFTWNDINCVTNANSEIDIEFAKWGDAGNPEPLEYSVQPTNGGQETDRFTTLPVQLSNNYSIHFFNWTPSLVSFSSYQGHTNPPPPGNLISSWQFSNNNIPKSKEECNSNPIIIPAPENNTTLNLNLWLDRGNYPSNDQEAEVIIHGIDYTPLR